MRAPLSDKPDHAPRVCNLVSPICRLALSAIVLSVVNAINNYFLARELYDPLLHQCQRLRFWVSNTSAMTSKRIAFACVPHICWLEILTVVCHQVC